MIIKLNSEDQNKINGLRCRYDELISQYRNYLNVNGYIQPKDFEEFFTWFVRFRHPDKPIKDLKVKAHDLQLFHEYEVRRFNNIGWDDAKEHKFLNDIEKQSNEKHNNEESNI